MDQELQKQRVQVYFGHVILRYNCGDVRALLDQKLKLAGPLLSCVVNGIDTVGGMMLGFQKNSKRRSTKFMRQHLSLSREEATLMYSLVRCGLAHEGVTKLTLRYFVLYEQSDPGVILYKDTYGERSSRDTIWLNVTELARSYLDAIGRIAQDVDAHLHYVPEPEPNDSTVYRDALPLIKNDINRLVDVEMNRREIGMGSGRPYPSDLFDASFSVE
jgi:hypothetical protein